MKGTGVSHWKLSSRLICSLGAASKLGAAGLLSAEEDQDTGSTSHSEHTSEHVNNMY